MVIDDCTPDDLPDEGVSENIPVAPCSPLAAFFVTDDPVEAEQLRKKMTTFFSKPLVDSPDPNNPNERKKETIMPRGVSYKSVMDHINNVGKNSENTKIKKLANGIVMQNAIIDEIRKKMTPERFISFLSLFSLSSRQQGQNSEELKLEVKGKEEKLGRIEFALNILEENELTRLTKTEIEADRVTPTELLVDQGDYGNPRIVQATNQGVMPKNKHVYGVGGALGNDFFEIVVSPYVIENKVVQYITHENETRSENIVHTNYNVSELADAVVSEIENILAYNNEVDILAGRIASGFEFAISVALCFTGIGGVFNAVNWATKAFHLGVFVLEGANAMGAGTQLYLGVREDKYNPLLALARSIDESGKDNSHTMEHVFHTVNMLMAFGKTRIIKTITIAGSGAAGATLSHLTLESASQPLEQQPIEEYERQSAEEENSQ